MTFVCFQPSNHQCLNFTLSFLIHVNYIVARATKIAYDAARKYNVDTTIEDLTPKEIAKAMQAACRKHLKQLLNEFVKHVCVANLALGNDFLLWIRLYWKSK